MTDLCIMTMNGCRRFIEETKLVDGESCGKNVLESIFHQMWAQQCEAEHVEGATKPESAMESSARQMTDDPKLTRHAFVAALVKVAICKYMVNGMYGDVSDAVERLFRAIATQVGSQLPVSDAFRREQCYTEEMSDVLLKHKPELKIIFQGLTALDPCRGPRDYPLLTLRCFRAFLRGLGFLDKEKSERESTLCFLWSIMCVVDARTVSGKLRQENLPFEGFLEAICRFATVKSLPTDEEVSESGAPDAGAYMANLKRTNEPAYITKQEGMSRKWAQMPDQPMHRCVDHLIYIMIRTIEDPDACGGRIGDLTSEDFREWARDHLTLR